MKRYVLLCFVYILFFSCQEQKDTKENPTLEKVATQGKSTPEALTNTTREVEFSYSSRSNKDIVDKLFDEAMKKDENLKKLYNHVYAMKKNKQDSLEAYYKYKNITVDYWATLNQHINRISDSTIKADIAGISESLKSKHKEKASPLISTESAIQKKELMLDDLVICMKVFVTCSMMDTYQTNELPSLGPLTSINKQYDSLIKEAKEYTQVRK